MHDDGKRRMVCPFVERKVGEALDIASPYGFGGFVGAGGSELVSTSWYRFAGERGVVCGYIGLHPTLSDPSWHTPSDVHRQTTLYLLDLTLSVEELFENLSTNRKRQLKHPSCAIELSDYEATEFLKEHGAKFFLRKQAALVSHFTTSTFAALAHSSKTFTFGCKAGPMLCALSMFAYTPYGAEYLFNISLPEAEDYAATLLWSGVQRLRCLRIPTLNLGGGIRSGDGVAEFKRRFGGKAVPYFCLKQVYNEAAFTQLCREYGVDPGDKSGYFPPYRLPLNDFDGVSLRL
ncbi:MAG: hypothetical protein H7Y20_10480 [Bryobacteraceae bacterium]|nr:hypothetical protein [Bryobacteraceae bacterium]